MNVMNFEKNNELEKKNNKENKSTILVNAQYVNPS